MNRVQKVLLGLLGGAAAFLMVAVAAGFVWSGMGESRTYDLGHVDSFAVGSVTTMVPRSASGEPLLGFTRSRGIPIHVHVARLSEDEFRAFTSVSSHLWCHVEWRSDSVYEGHHGVFFDICSNSRWALHGQLLFGPASSDLDRVGVRVVGGRVVVLLDEVTKGVSQRSRR